MSYIDLVLWQPDLTLSMSRCGNVGKLTRICATVSDAAFAASYPRKNSADQFLVLGGYSDFLVPATYAAGHGCITGLANVAPVSGLSAERLILHPHFVHTVLDRKLVRAFHRESREPEAAA